MIKFALIGCGHIAKRHAEHITKHGELVAVCDVMPEKADGLAKQYGAIAYYNIDDLIASHTNINVACICTPNGLHAMHTIKSLNAGYNVLCEKPMATKVIDCQKMIEAAVRNQKHLFIVKQNRFNPPVQKVKELIDNNVLGKIYSIQLSCFWNRNTDYYNNSWKGTLALDGGTLYTQFSHFIDLLYWMIGDVDDVQAITRNYNHQNTIEFEDTGVVIMTFKNGAIGSMNYTVNSFEQNMEGSLTIFAENGTVKIGGQYLNTLEYQKIRNYTIPALPKGNIANNYGGYQGSMSNHDKVFENIVDVLERGANIATNAYEGMKVVEIIDKIYNSGQLPVRI